MPVKKKKTFIKRTTEKKGSNTKPNVSEKEVVTEEIETTEQVTPDEKSAELETKALEPEVSDVVSENPPEEVKDEEGSNNETEKLIDTEEIEEVPSRLEQIAEEQAKDESSNSSKAGLLWGVVPVILIAGIITGGLYVYNLGFSNGKSQALKDLPKESISQKITPTEMPLKLDEFSIEVLNGSGVGGEAGKVSDQLTEAGFDVLSTGNADSSDYDKTVIKVKEKVKEPYVKKLLEELEKTYDLDKTEILDDAEIYDVIVIVGSSTVE